MQLAKAIGENWPRSCALNRRSSMPNEKAYCVGGRHPAVKKCAVYGRRRSETIAVQLAHGCHLRIHRRASCWNDHASQRALRVQRLDSLWLVCNDWMWPARPEVLGRL